MSYRVVVMVPSEEYPGNREVCFCELRYSLSRRFIWFGRQSLHIDVVFGDHSDIKPLERKEDTDLTAQMVYLALRRADVRVEVVECPAPPLKPDSAKWAKKEIKKWQC